MGCFNFFKNFRRRSDRVVGPEAEPEVEMMVLPQPHLKRQSSTYKEVAGFPTIHELSTQELQDLQSMDGQGESHTSSCLSHH